MERIETRNARASQALTIADSTLPQRIGSTLHMLTRVIEGLGAVRLRTTLHYSV
jgi:hypothetical protein